MKLTTVINLWDRLHKKDIGELGFCDLADAIEAEVGLENDICPNPPSVGLADLREKLWAMMTSKEAMDWQEGTAYKFLALQLKREIRSTADLTEEELNKCIGFLEESLP